MSSVSLSGSSSGPGSLADRFVRPDGIYLLSHSIGLPVADARRAADDYFDTWERDTAGAWTKWLSTLDRFRDALGAVLNGERASFCPQSNVSSGLTKILGALRLTGRSQQPTILMTEDAFPSLGYVCSQASEDVRFIGRDAAVTDPAAWDRHLTDDVDIVIITHVHSNTGELIPVQAIAERARAAGIVSIVDVAQSVGVIPIDVTGWGADFVVGSCVKWLCGGPGAGWLWAAPDMIDRCEPTDVGWFSHDDPFEFDIHRFRYAGDALRFWGGSPTVLPFAVAGRSIETIADIGVDVVRSHNLDMTQRVIDHLGARVVSPHDGEVRSGTCIVEGGEGLASALADAGVAVDHRANGVRLSPHVYNSAADIDLALDVIDRHPT